MIGQHCYHHGDGVAALGKRPWGCKEQSGGVSGDSGGTGEGREEAKGAVQGGREGSDEETTQRGGGMGYLSAFDVKSLRQKHSGAECCPTCTGSTQHQRQHGDGEDEGREIKTSVEEIK